MNRTWLVTGASSGLGREMTAQLLDRGDRVVATVRRDGVLADMEARHGDRLTCLVLDVTDRGAVRARVDEAFRRLGRIDVVVGNAGYGLLGAAEELADEQIDRQIATNLVGSIDLVRAALPHLRRQGGGRVVQISSEGGQIAYPGFSLYHATKWGIEGFIEAVSQEVAPFGIDFVIAEPGPTATNFGASLDRAAPLDVYAGTPVAGVRDAITGGTFAIKGDAARTVAAVISAADAERPALRLTLGSTAYDSISRALSDRLTLLRAQRDVAVSADRA